MPPGVTRTSISGSALAAASALFAASRAYAALQDRTYVIPDDVKALLESTFAHRLIISPSARIKNVEARAVVEQIAQSVPVPGTRVRAR